MRIRHKAKHTEVERYIRYVNEGYFIPGSPDQLCAVRDMLDNLELDPGERHWLNAHRRRLEDARPKHPYPGRPTKRAIEELAVRTALHEIEKIVDEAELGLPTGGQDDGAGS